MSVVAVIPARGGSKALPRKNILPLAGMPLLAYTVRDAREAKRIDRTIVSTDDAEIAEVARAAGAEVPFVRPAGAPHRARAELLKKADGEVCRDLQANRQLCIVAERI